MEEDADMTSEFQRRKRGEEGRGPFTKYRLLEPSRFPANPEPRRLLLPDPHGKVPPVGDPQLPFAPIPTPPHGRSLSTRHEEGRCVDGGRASAVRSRRGRRTTDDGTRCQRRNPGSSIPTERSTPVRRHAFPPTPPRHLTRVVTEECAPVGPGVRMEWRGLVVPKRGV